MTDASSEEVYNVRRHMLGVLKNPFYEAQRFDTALKKKNQASQNLLLCFVFLPVVFLLVSSETVSSLALKGSGVVAYISAVCFQLYNWGVYVSLLWNKKAQKELLHRQEVLDYLNDHLEVLCLEDLKLLKKIIPEDNEWALNWLASLNAFNKYRINNIERVRNEKLFLGEAPSECVKAHQRPTLSCIDGSAPLLNGSPIKDTLQDEQKQDGVASPTVFEKKKRGNVVFLSKKEL